MQDAKQVLPDAAVTDRSAGRRTELLHAMQGTCPECNTENFTYFGDILTVAGSRSETTISCKECKTQLKFNADDRMVSSHTFAPVPGV